MIKKSLTILLTVALTTVASVWIMGRYFRFVPTEEYSAQRSQLSVPEVRSTDVPSYVTASWATWNGYRNRWNGLTA